MLWVPFFWKLHFNRDGVNYLYSLILHRASQPQCPLRNNRTTDNVGNGFWEWLQLFTQTCSDLHSTCSSAESISWVPMDQHIYRTLLTRAVTGGLSQVLPRQAFPVPHCILALLGGLGPSHTQPGVAEHRLCLCSRWHGQHWALGLVGSAWPEPTELHSKVS